MEEVRRKSKLVRKELEKKREKNRRMKEKCQKHEGRREKVEDKRKIRNRIGDKEKWRKQVEGETLKELRGKRRGGRDKGISQEVEEWRRKPKKW